MGFVGRGKGCLFCHGHSDQPSVKLEVLADEKRGALDELEGELHTLQLELSEKQLENALELETKDPKPPPQQRELPPEPEQSLEESKNCRHCGNRRCRFLEPNVPGQPKPELAVIVPGGFICKFGAGCKFCHAIDGVCHLARRKSAREKRKQRLHHCLIIGPSAVYRRSWTPF